MFKQVAKSERIQALIAKAYGDDDVRLDDLAIFEAVAINTLPLTRRKGGLFEGAVIGEDVLLAMKDWLDAGNHVPLQLMHRSGIPAGKVFAGELRSNPDGSRALHTLFYLPRVESELVRKIDAGVVAEVSIGVENEKIFCSACGFDYLGAEATFDNVFERTCAHGHTIGKDGVHARLHGLSKWMELSLVDRGAANGANILTRPKQTFSATPERGFDPSAVRLFASFETPPQETPPKMDEKVVQLRAELIVANKERDEHKAAKEKVDAELVSAQAKLTETETKLAEALKGDAAELKAELASATELLDELATAALSALGRGSETLPEKVADKVKVVRDARAQLAMAIPTGGVTKPAAGDADKSGGPPSYAAFTTARK